MDHHHQARLKLVSTLIFWLTLFPDVEASDHLSDAQGRQMTPVARTTGPSGPLSLTSGKEVAQQYHKIRGNRTDRDKAKTAL